MGNLALLVQKLRKEKSLFFELLDKARREAVDVDSILLFMAAIEGLKEYERAGGRAVRDSSCRYSTTN